MIRRPDHLQAFSICLCLLSANSSAATHTNPYTQIVESTGLTALLQVVPLEITESAKSHAHRCAAIPAPAAVNQDVLPATLRQNIANVITVAEAHEISGWYRSAAGSKITELEKQSTSEAELDKFIDNRSKNPNWMASRYPLFKRIYENTGAGEVNATMGVEIEYAGLTVSGCIEKYARENPANAGSGNAEQVMANIIRHDKALMMALFTQQSQFSMAFTLRNLSTAELTAYAEFTQQHQEFYQSLVQSFELTLKGYSDSLAQQQIELANSQAAE